MKKNWRGWIFYYINFIHFFPLFFLQQPLPLCKYFNFAANKLSPIGMNLFLLLSRHIKHSNFEGIQMLCEQQGQNMNLFIGCRVFYGLDGTAVEWRPKGDHSPIADLAKKWNLYFYHLQYNLSQISRGGYRSRLIIIKSCC